MKNKTKIDPPQKKKGGQKAMAKKEDAEKRITANLTDKNQISVNLVKNFQQQTGCTTKDGVEALLEIGLKAAPDGAPDERAKAADQVLAMMAEMKPLDAFEGILITQMVLVHKQAMHQLSLANLDGNIGRTDLQESLLNRYSKLMRLYNQQLETLDRHRRKGNQKVTVEHVTVNEGGQAIVGNVEGGGGNSEK